MTHREVDELVGVFDEWTEKASELDAREQSGDLTLEEHDKLVSDLKDTYEQKVDQLLGDRGDLFVELSQNLLQERLQALSSAARGAEDSGSVEHFFGE